MKQMVFLIALTFSSLPAPVQSREFEVASIKPTNLVNAGVKSAFHGIDSKFAAKDLAATVALGRCVISSGRLSHMIGVAYGITMDVPADPIPGLAAVAGIFRRSSAGTRNV